MKKLTFKLFAISLLFAFSACGSSDDEKEEKVFLGDCKQTVEVKGFKGQLSSTDPAITATLDDMLKNTSGYGSPVTAGEFLLTTTSIKITGLKEGVTLNGFKISINGIEESFGNISPVQGTTGFDLYSGSHLDYFKNAFNRMVSSRKLETKITFTPSVDILSEDNVKLEIVFSGRFSYWVKL
jgi:hypothetical protein